MSLLKLLKENAYQKREVTLSSGKKSNFYMDVKRVSLTAEGSYYLGQELFAALQKHYPTAVAAGGLTLGADPLATALALSSWVAKKPIQAFIIRKQSKEHGLAKLIEGSDLIPPKSPVVILEDVVTSGKSSLEAIQKAKSQGWQVLGVLAVVDREEGGKENILKEDCRFFSLYRKSDFGIVE